MNPIYRTRRRNDLIVRLLCLAAAIFGVMTAMAPRTTGAISAYFIFVNIGHLLLSYQQRGSAAVSLAEVRPGWPVDNHAHLERVIRSA